MILLSHGRSNEMLTARYANTGETEIEGDFDGLLKLSKALSGELPSTEIVFDSGDAQPYDALLELLRVDQEPDDRPVLIVRVARQLVLSGSPSKLGVLAENIRFLLSSGADPNSSIQDHIHIEYHENHPYLDAKAAPLTISYINR